MRFTITGGAGFTGINFADALLAQGHEVALLDNLSRHGAEANLAWLEQRWSGTGRVRFHRGDIRRDLDTLARALSGADVVYHLAAQVAVTASVSDPRTDFETNALGTLNVLEAVRGQARPPILVYASTNKVYGAMDDVEATQAGKRYAYVGLPAGVPESRPLDFHSPYGCSKGAADQYVRDFGRIYGLRTVVMRQSCIYGPRQFGVEDQGWVAWFIIAALLGRPITIFGDGMQVRDVLHVDDLFRAYQAAVTHIARTAGRIYNIGGGPQHTLSLLELIELLERRTGRKVAFRKADWRRGDQRIYVSDISNAKRDFGWMPTIGAAEGVERLAAWVSEHADLFRPAGTEST